MALLWTLKRPVYIQVNEGFMPVAGGSAGGAFALFKRVALG